jgi:enterochelin esterase-like enzyme
MIETISHFGFFHRAKTDQYLQEGSRLSYKVMLLLLSLLLILPSAAFSQSFTSFEDFLRQYEASSPELRHELAQSFLEWQRVRGGFPIVDRNGNAVFFYLGNGKEQDVRVVGDFHPSSFFNIYWDSIGEPMTREGSVFYKRNKFEPDARIDYKFIIDGQSTIDPLNPHTLFSGAGGGEVSELIMPGFILSTETLERPGIPKGTLHIVQEPWATPKVTIYLPPGYDPSKDYPTLYTADGSAWVEIIKLPTILDNLIADRAIEPIIAVMIDAAKDRRAWYYFNPEYLAYLRRVVSHVDSHYSTRARVEERVHVGSSAGGRITLYTGLELPGLFRNLGMLSPSFDGPAYYYEPYFSGRKRPDPNLRVWLSAGTYEGSIHRDAQTMEVYFKKVGAKMKFVYVHQGHSFGAWRNLTPDMLKYFFVSKKR